MQRLILQMPSSGLISAEAYCSMHTQRHMAKEVLLQPEHITAVLRALDLSYKESNSCWIHLTRLQSYMTFRFMLQLTSGAGNNLKVGEGTPVRIESGGRHRSGAKHQNKNFLDVPLHFLAIKAQLVAW